MNFQFLSRYSALFVDEQNESLSNSISKISSQFSQYKLVSQLEMACDILRIMEFDLLFVSEQALAKFLKGRDMKDLKFRAKTMSLLQKPGLIVSREDVLSPLPGLFHTFRSLDCIQKSEFSESLLMKSIEFCVFKKESERAQEKISSQLYQAQKMEVIGQLTGGVAHDFNNKLAIISGNISAAVQMLGPDHEVVEFLLTAKTSVDRSAELTRQLLSFSRVKEVQNKVVQIANVISESVKVLRSLLEASIEIRAEIVGEIHPICVDPHQVDQILMNLIINARDAMPSGGTITVRVQNEDRGGLPGVGISVADTGTGMESDVCEKIFEPFFTTKEVGVGTGLGLAIVKKVVEEMHGEIGVESELYKGTTFGLFFPKAEVSAPKLVELEQPKNIDLAGLTVLYVEDESELRSIVRELLKGHGCDLIEASDGMSALEILDKGDVAIDLVITDVVMPKMNGKQLLDRIRFYRCDLPVLFVSGYSPYALNSSGELPRNTDFVEKPFTEKDLIEKMADLVEAADDAPSGRYKKSA